MQVWFMCGHAHDGTVLRRLLQKFMAMVLIKSMFVPGILLVISRISTSQALCKLLLNYTYTPECIALASSL